MKIVDWDLDGRRNRWTSEPLKVKDLGTLYFHIIRESFQNWTLTRELVVVDEDENSNSTITKSWDYFPGLRLGQEAAQRWLDAGIDAPYPSEDSEDSDETEE